VIPTAWVFADLHHERARDAQHLTTHFPGSVRRECHTKWAIFVMFCHARSRCSCPYMTATEVVGNVGSYTAPRRRSRFTSWWKPPYGTSGLPDLCSAGSRRQNQGGSFSTDSTRNIDVSRSIWIANGNVTFREPSWVANFTVEPGLPGIGRKDVGRTLSAGRQLRPPRRHLAARISGGVLGKNKSGAWIR